MSEIRSKSGSRFTIFVPLLALACAACNPIIGIGGPIGPDGGGGGGPGLLCVPNEPDGGVPEVTDIYPDGQDCVVTYCNELDPDQQGQSGGDGPGGPVPLLPDAGTPMRFTGGCETDDGTCMPHPHLDATKTTPLHRGGNLRHNRCANAHGPHRNDYYMGSFAPVEPGGGDAVLHGFCLDGVHVYQNQGETIHAFWEIKTARYGFSRSSNRPVCTFIKRKILTDVFASILKEYPAVRSCGRNYRYAMVFADVELERAITSLRVNIQNGVPALNLLYPNRRPDADPAKWDPKREVGFDALVEQTLRERLKQVNPSPADAAAAKANLLEYLNGPPPESVIAYVARQACDNEPNN